ncbi:hypothetical protein Afil01_34550 [Actinorhabdospora filicis]|uniref:Uncharacterized protein n=1 Tax=Actinorhabdospora filicis TaxID=1785913 RepID=A0A9W6SLW5_9ACTN|nr:hypothetical protein [Actinorhabdospora filicis]GLZ78648.1 hypothetical protein Afil01_34550 [Actinorhabdospora filicis]
MKTLTGRLADRLLAALAPPKRARAACPPEPGCYTNSNCRSRKRHGYTSGDCVFHWQACC